jgi:prepilin-type N-terminal cleavage/methylation domain-containing protein
MPRRPYASSGFTLIEMSIVLVIVGLLIGGVLSGQYLIKQAEVQNMIVSMTKYRSAYLQFKNQYGGPPGDIIDATEYWGTDNATTACASVITTFVAGDRVPKTVTCNGNGNGALTIVADSTISNVAQRTNDVQETWRAWQQLANAGLVDGSFTGVVGADNSAATTRDTVPGQNAPATKRNGGGYSMYWLPTVAAANTATYGDYYYGTYGIVLLLGGTVSGDLTKGGLLTPAEAWRIDTAMDDGIPGTGQVFTLGSLTNCVTDTTPASAGVSRPTTSLYATANTGTVCNFALKLDAQAQ